MRGLTAHSQAKAASVKDDLMNRLSNAIKQRDAAREEALLAAEKLNKLQEDLDNGVLQAAGPAPGGLGNNSPMHPSLTPPALGGAEPGQPLHYPLWEDPLPDRSHLANTQVLDPERLDTGHCLSFRKAGRDDRVQTAGFRVCCSCRAASLCQICLASSTYILLLSPGRQEPVVYSVCNS